MSLPLLSIKQYVTNPHQFSNQLRQACHNVGFFLLRHDISPQVCQRALEETRLFFQKPLHQKMEISYENNPSFRGYMPMGVENTEGRVDGREQVEYAAEYHDRGYDCSNPLPGDHYYHRLRAASNPWPDTNQPNLRPAIMEYVNGVLDVADRLRDAMCLALKADPNEVAPLFGKSETKHKKLQSNRGGDEDGDDNIPFWSMKMVSYPPTKSNIDDQSATQGVGAHTDTNFLTLILQDPNHSGLQVQSVEDGSWIDVPPTESDILVCNIGELAEIWSDGYFLATPHRVVRHTNRDADPTIENCRTSIPIFYNPTINTRMEPLANLDAMPWERNSNVIKKKRWQRENNHLLRSVGENSFKSLARSHPRVFQRHHGDLMILDDGRIVKR